MEAAVLEWQQLALSDLKSSGERSRRRDDVFNRTAAMAIGIERVRAAKNTRGLFP